ncbi:GLPGLI family protein [Puia sp. P3]|uniref:GLPGLI family protein n=1 Tax=Puia sp. P3 TaxID=3423952 RepID=UPI003D66F889
MSRIIFTLLLTIAAATNAAAQSNTVFLSQGKIEFEKTINMYARISADDDGAWSDLLKKMNSHFKKSYYDLYFNHGKSLYRPGRESGEKDNMWIQPPAQDNIVYSDIDKDQGICQKNIFDQVFLVQDSLRQIKWKITTETRTIAGFNCRRANAIIMDSIYVVAFYTDEILTSSGPESFTGLPGMILGISLPHEHISWFATKVEAVPVAETQLAPPIKGKKTDRTALTNTVRQGLGDKGKYGRRFMQDALL